MKKTYGFIVAMLLSLGAFSQSPTITSAEFEVPGDSLVFQPVVSSNFNPGASGAGVTWDFSHLVSAGAGQVQYWVLPSANPNGDSFPAANQSILSPILPGVFNVDGYYQLTASVLAIRGYEVPDITYYYDAKDFMRFPCTYTNTFTDSFHATVSPQGSPSYVRLGAIQVHADGYGTLKLPTGTFTNVLRVKFVENYKDDLSSLGAGEVDYYNLEYNYYKAGVKGPLLAYDSLKYTNTNPTVLLSYQKNLAGTNGIHDLESSAVHIYPNPAHHTVTIASAEANYDCTITDLNGEMVINTQVAKNANKQINVEALAGGLYFINLKADDGSTVTRKLVVN
jgi:hypothetical protein